MDEDEKPIGELFGRLIDEGKAYAKAEAGVARAHAEVQLDRFKVPALLLAGAFLLLIAGTVALVQTIADALATLIGPLAGGLVATAVALAAAGGLAMLAKQRLEAGR
jgi:hypothetical protein